MDACCDDIVGGEVFITYGDKRYEAMGDVSISPLSTERDAGATSGGRLMVTVKAKPATADITFVNHCDADPLEMFNAGCKINVTVVEKSRGIRHLFTDAIVVGTATINLASGEFGGFRIATDKYSRN